MVKETNIRDMPDEFGGKNCVQKPYPNAEYSLYDLADDKEVRLFAGNKWHDVWAISDLSVGDRLSVESDAMQGPVYQVTLIVPSRQTPSKPVVIVKFVPFEKRGHRDDRIENDNADG